MGFTPLIPLQTEGKRVMLNVSSLFPHDTMDINTGSMNNFICRTYLSWLILNKTEMSMRSESKVRREMINDFLKLVFLFQSPREDNLKRCFMQGHFENHCLGADFCSTTLTLKQKRVVSMANYHLDRVILTK